MQPDIKIEGADRVAHIMSNVGPRVARNLMRSTVAGLATEARKEIRDDAPQDDGVLKANIVSRRRRGGPGYVQADVLVNRRRAFYWTFLEFGTQKLAEAPFVRPAIERIKATVMRRFIAMFRRRFISLLKRRARSGM